MSKTTSIIFRIILLAAFAALAPAQSFAVGEQSCTTDEAYVQGQLWRYGGRVAVRATWPAPSVTKTGRGAIKNLARERACGKSALEAANSLAYSGTTYFEYADALCTRSVVADSNHADASNPLPRGENVVVMATSVVVQSSQDRDVKAPNGLPSYAVRCDSPNGTKGAFCSDVLGKLGVLQHTITSLNCPTPSGMGSPSASISAWANWCMATPLTSIVRTYLTTLNAADSCTKQRTRELWASAQYGDLPGFCNRYADLGLALEGYYVAISRTIWEDGGLLPGNVYRNSDRLCALRGRDRLSVKTRDEYMALCQSQTTIIPRTPAGPWPGENPPSRQCPNSKTTPACGEAANNLLHILDMTEDCAPLIPIGRRYVTPVTSQQ